MRQKVMNRDFFEIWLPDTWVVRAQDTVCAKNRSIELEFFLLDEQKNRRGVIGLVTLQMRNEWAGVAFSPLALSATPNASA